MLRIAIIGGGTSGLSAAYHLDRQKRAGSSLEYVVYERAPQAGGVLRSERVAGCLLEAGPDSFLTEKPWALALCRELGLSDQIIGSNDAQRKTYIVVRNRLVRMPDGLMFMVPTKIWPMVFTSLFSWSTKARIVQEYFCRPQTLAGDESVAAMVHRHFGAEMVDRVADPLLSGIYGADADVLSARTVLPRFVEMEQKYGSLSRGMLAARRRMAEVTGNRPKPPLFSSLKEGMQQLVDALLARLDARAFCLGREVEQVQFTGSEWVVTAADARDRFDSVVMATPAHVAGHLLAGQDADLAEELSGISYSSSVIVSLIFERKQLDRIAGADGFGFLVPRSECRRVRAATFVHNKFPHRVPEELGIVRCALGGLRDEAAWQMSDEEVLRTVKDELFEILGISAGPRAARIYRWRRAMAQPFPGHLERLARIDRRLERLPGLALAGNYFRGIGVPDAIRTGQEAAERTSSQHSALRSQQNLSSH
jgi:oxygen-dependent protoporphyrinogen oxidase